MDFNRIFMCMVAFGAVLGGVEYFVNMDLVKGTKPILAKLTSGVIALVIACMILEKSGFFEA